MKTFLIICLLGCCLLPELAAQPTLELHKRGTKNYYYFQVGDTLELGLKNNQEIKSTWNYVAEDAILLYDTVVHLEDIDWIRVRDIREEASRWRLPANFFIMAGAGYFLIDQINHSLIESNPVSINRNVAISSAALVATGLAIKVFSGAWRSQEVRIRGRYVLHLVDYSYSEEDWRFERDRLID